MAITIISNFTSGKFYPSANPINITVNSNNSGNCNFRYICDLYVNGVKVFTDKLFPDPTTGYAFFQLSRVIQDYIKTVVPYAPYPALMNLAAGLTAPTSQLTISCKFGEEYDSTTTCDGTVLQYLNLATSNTMYVYQAAFDYESFPSYSDTPYKGVWSSTPNLMKFLTNSPRENEITYNDSYFLDFISNTSPTPFTSPLVGCVKIEIAVFLKDGTTGSTTIPAPSLAVYRRYRLAVGPYDINKVVGFPYISQFTDRYTIRLIWQVGSGTIYDMSETFTFNVRAPKAFQTRIGFVGLLGGIEHFTFFHRNMKSFDIERKTFEKTLQSNTSGTWRYAVGDRGTTTYGVKAKEKHMVSSYCERKTSQWLYEMWLSPDVWTYQRPELLEWTNYKEGNPNVILGTDRILFYLPDDHGLVVGDSFFCFPSNDNPDWSIFNSVFTITSINGNIVDVGMTVGTWVEYNACGYLYKSANWARLPITISDNTIDVKQKTSKPVEYTLNYQMAYSKTTLR
jgi:hypothetical protein